ncbi:hypothetical protein [Streptomyces sp. NPDC020817]|uniref:hypothetical protein n=1 Tax=Streptomyces sp. NPDC020817 TaxID=3365095 RepID=UPI0037A6BBD8
MVSRRVDEYRQAQCPAAGVPVKLAGAAGIELRPLAAGETAAYLSRDAGGENTVSAARCPLPAARWQRVPARLDSGTPVGQALRTPLMVFLARTVYNPRPGETAAGLPDPAELCDEDRLPTPAAVERRLLEALPAAYRSRPGTCCRWSPQRAEHVLVLLARHLQHRLQGTPDLPWWQLHEAVHRRLHQCLLAASAAFAAGFRAVGAGLGTGIGIGLAAGFLGWRTGGQPRRLPAVAFRWSGTGFALGLLWAFGFGPILVLLARSAPALGLLGGLLLGPVVGARLGHGAVALAGQETLALIPAFSVCGAFAYTAWGHFTPTRCHLTLRHRLPRDLLAFLADAHQRGVLRQVGAV